MTDAKAPPPELDEIVGYHLEQAVMHRRAGGASDATDLVAATRAGERLASAAERAIARFDQAAAENLLARSRAMLPLDRARRALLTQSLAEVGLVLGRFSEAQQLLLEVAGNAAAAGDEVAEWSARLEHARIQFMIGPDPVPLAMVRRAAEQAADFYARANDDAGQGRAAFPMGCVHLRQGGMTAAERAFRTSLAFADRGPGFARG